MSDIVTLWHAEHAKFTRLLDQLAARVDRLAQGDDEQTQTVSDIVAYLHHYGERAHHPREDIGFARLADTQPSFASVVAELHREHDAIIEAGRTLVEQLERLSAGEAIVSRDAITRNATHYMALQRSHLDREETQIIPTIAQRFGEADWKAVKAAIADKVDTRLPPDLLPRFRELSREIAFELAEH